jgi:hypothetical protein
VEIGLFPQLGRAGFQELLTGTPDIAEDQHGQQRGVLQYVAPQGLLQIRQGDLAGEAL